MLTTLDVRSARVGKPHKPGKEVDKNGVPRRHAKIGKVFKTVFSPDGLKVVGFIVKRPDLLWMIKRPERFLALDAIDIQDGVIVPVKGSKSWDDEAIKRLGIDWDKCIIWEGMPVKTQSGIDLGMVDELAFDEGTGALNSLFLDDGMASRALLGCIEIPVELMVGYKKGVLYVQDEAKALMPAGGLAAKAGEATAKVSIEAKKSQQAATDATTKAIEAGAVGLGKRVGGLKRGMADAVEGFKKESGVGAKPKPKAASAAKAAPSGGSGAKKQAPSSSTKPKPKAKSSASGAKKAVADHMKSAGSMFSDFKKEFDKARK